jgi:hypothetical protein
MFQLAIYMGYRQDELFVPEQQRKQYVSVVYVSGKMSNKNMEQRINIQFCIKICKSASETLLLLTLAYSECATKKLGVFEQQRQFKEGRAR